MALSGTFAPDLDFDIGRLFDIFELVRSERHRAEQNPLDPSVDLAVLIHSHRPRQLATNFHLLHVPMKKHLNSSSRAGRDVTQKPTRATIAIGMYIQTNFSWFHELAIPAFFTLFGAALGFFAGQLREDRNAKQAKTSFLQAIGMELDALGKQLHDSLGEVQNSANRVKGRSQTGPQFAWALRTSVFASQVGKLRDVSDPLLIEIVHFYSDLGTLEHIFQSANETSAEFTSADIFSGQQEKIRPRLESTLIELQNQISIFGNRLRTLRAKLPVAVQ